MFEENESLPSIAERKWFRTVENGRAVEFEEGVWEAAELTEVVDGYPIFVRRTM